MRLVVHAHPPDRQLERVQQRAMGALHPPRIRLARVAVAHQIELLGVEHPRTRRGRDAQHHRRRLADLEHEVASDVSSADGQLSLVTSTVTAR